MRGDTLLPCIHCWMDCRSYVTPSQATTGSAIRLHWKGHIAQVNDSSAAIDYARKRGRAATRQAVLAAFAVITMVIACAVSH